MMEKFCQGSIVVQTKVKNKKKNKKKAMKKKVTKKLSKDEVLVSREMKKIMSGREKLSCFFLDYLGETRR